jgi:2Fe-2S ferredoxin
MGSVSRSMVAARPVPRITFEQPDGVRRTLDVPAGTRAVDAALDHGVAGIVAQCGGACTCGTCHCHVVPAWRARVGAAEGDEAELLSYLPLRGPGSRLCCRIVVDDALDGVELRVAERQY